MLASESNALIKTETSYKLFSSQTRDSACATCLGFEQRLPNFTADLGDDHYAFEEIRDKSTLSFSIHTSVTSNVSTLTIRTLFLPIECVTFFPKISLTL